MRTLEPDRPRFYFALPRLFAWLRSRNSARTEKNWVEANIAGAAVMLVSYLAIAHWLFADVARWKQIALLLPAIVVTWVFWLIVLYVNAQIIKVLRAAGALANLSNARAQSVLIGAVASALACYLLDAGALLHGIAVAWISAVCINLLAAVFLALLRSDNGS